MSNSVRESSDSRDGSLCESSRNNSPAERRERIALEFSRHIKLVPVDPDAYERHGDYFDNTDDNLLWRVKPESEAAFIDAILSSDLVGMDQKKSIAQSDHQTEQSAPNLSEATARPWIVAGVCFGELWVTGPTPTLPVCMITAGNNVSAKDWADAALIVRAVNNHDALIRALAFYADPKTWAWEGSHGEIFGKKFGNTPAYENDRGKIAAAALNSLPEAS